MQYYIPHPGPLPQAGEGVKKHLIYPLAHLWERAGVRVQKHELTMTIKLTDIPVVVESGNKYINKQGIKAIKDGVKTTWH